MSEILHTSEKSQNSKKINPTLKNFQKKTNKNRHWPSELTRNGRDWSIESDQLKIERMVMIPRKIESGMDTTNDRRMTENGPIYERRMEGRGWFNY